MSNRWKIIFTAVLFNLSFEYSLRGVVNLKSHPVLLIVLFFSYFFLFTMLEDLIVRYRLKAYHLMYLAFFYGSITLFWVSGNVFIPPLLWGVKWPTLILVNLFWWGALQAVLTFYFANSLHPRDWNHPRMSKVGWVVCVLGSLLMIVLFQKSGVIPHGTPIGRLIMWGVIAISFIAVRMVWPKKIAELPIFRPSKFLSFLCWITLVLFLFAGTFLTKNPIISDTSQVDAIALRVVTLWTFLLGVTLFLYRYIGKKEIGV